MACINNSSINVPSDASTQQQVINSSSEFFIGPTGDDVSNNGSIAEPWASLQKAFNYLENYRITENGSVTLYILPTLRSPSLAGWTGAINGSETTLNHAQSERIHIAGYNHNTLNLYGVNYYDTAQRALGPHIMPGGTGGYIMELLVGDAGPVEVGDFISIRDLSYTGTGESGVTGATVIETDINYEYINTDGRSGSTSGVGAMSLRKTLMYGVHEVLALDSTTTKANSILVHVRHHNPTSYGGADQQNFIGGAGGPSADEGGYAGMHGACGAGGTAYMTPQGLRFNNADALFHNSLSVTTVSGNEWSAGVTMSRLGKTFPYYADLGTGSSGGATGNLGITWGVENEGEGDVVGQHGSDGITWDYQTLQVELKHLPARINFNSGGGINISNCKLGSIKNIVLCGPGFDTGVSGHLLPIDSSTGINVIDGGGINTTENLCVAGFENGIAVRKESGADISEVVVSSCLNGILVEDSSSAIAKSSIVSGCSQGFLIRESSSIDAQASISTANMSNGVNIEKNSYGNFHRSLSTFNGGNGYVVQESSTGQFHNPYVTDYADFLVTRGTEGGGASAEQDTRHGWSTRTGSVAFRNALSGWKVDNNSHAKTDECRSSYNGYHGFQLHHSASMHGKYSGAYCNGLQSPFHRGHGYQCGSGVNVWVDYSRSVGNTGSGYLSAKNSYCEADYSRCITRGSTGYWSWKDSGMNAHSATGEIATGTIYSNISFFADVDSKIWIDSSTSGTKYAGVSAAIRQGSETDGG